MSRSPGTTTAFSALSVACERFMLGKISLASSSSCDHEHRRKIRATETEDGRPLLKSRPELETVNM